MGDEHILKSIDYVVGKTNKIFLFIYYRSLELKHRVSIEIEFGKFNVII